jgi:hypothetical protein
MRRLRRMTRTAVLAIAGAALTPIAAIAAIAAILPLSACADARIILGGPGDSGSSSGGGAAGAVDGGPSVSILGDGSYDGGTDCFEAAKLIYAISDANNLYSFDPSKLAGQPFTLIGPVRCPTSSTVNSMAVDRHGTAWVNYADGQIFKVSTSVPITCQTTSFIAGQQGFSNVLGMGFSSDAPGSQMESLFVSDNNGLGLAKIDVSTMKLNAIGAYTGSLAGYSAELTGSGDAKLYGFFTTYNTGTTASLAQIDKASGATPNVTSLPTVNASNGGYAFSFWGGDFWFYTAYPTSMNPNATTSVTHFQTSTGTATVVLKDQGFTIVGAGVSTCAPTTVPQ